MIRRVRGIMTDHIHVVDAGIFAHRVGQIEVVRRSIEGLLDKTSCEYTEVEAEEWLRADLAAQSDLTVEERERLIQIGIEMAIAALTDQDVDRDDWVSGVAEDYLKKTGGVSDELELTRLLVDEVGRHGETTAMRQARLVALGLAVANEMVNCFPDFFVLPTRNKR